MSLDSELSVIAAALRDPARHTAKLAGLPVEVFKDRICRSFRKLLGVRALTFASAAKFLERQIKSEALRSEMLGYLPRLDAVGEEQDADIDYSIKELIDQAKKDHIAERTRWMIECLKEGKLTKAEEVATLLANELKGFGGAGDGLRDIGSLVASTISSAKAAKATGGVFMPTGFEKLDAVVGGGKRGELCLVAGSTSHGKTQVAHSIAYYRWLCEDVVVWLPREMSIAEMSAMFAARHSSTSRASSRAP